MVLQVLVLGWGCQAKLVTSNLISDLPNLVSTQEEADTKILLHANHITHTPNLVVSSPDTDVFVLCAHHFPSMPNCSKLWFKTGTKDHTRYIPIHDMCDVLEPQLRSFTRLQAVIQPAHLLGRPRSCHGNF